MVFVSVLDIGCSERYSISGSVFPTRVLKKLADRECAVPSVYFLVQIR